MRSPADAKYNGVAWSDRWTKQFLIESRGAFRIETDIITLFKRLV